MARRKTHSASPNVDDLYDDTEYGSIDRFKAVLHARMHVLMNNRRAEGKGTCNAGSAKAFVFAVANHDRGQELGCCAKQATLERESGLSPDTQSRIAAVLEDAGVLRIQRRHRKAGARKRYSSNIYHLDYRALCSMAMLEPAHDERGSTPGDPPGDPGDDAETREKPRTTCAGPTYTKSSRSLPDESSSSAENAGGSPEKTSRKLRDDRGGRKTSRKLRDDRGGRKTSRKLRDDLQNIPQSAGRSSRKLPDDHPANCGTNIQTGTTPDLTTQQAAAAAVGEERAARPVCVSVPPAEPPPPDTPPDEPASASTGADARRDQLAEQARRLRNRKRAEQMLREQGVWERTIPELIAAAEAHSGGGDALGRIETVIAAAGREREKARARGRPMNPAKWITAAILEGWDVNAPSQRQAG